MDDSDTQAALARFERELRVWVDDQDDLLRKIERGMDVLIDNLSVQLRPYRRGGLIQSAPRTRRAKLSYCRHIGRELRRVRRTWDTFQTIQAPQMTGEASPVPNA